MGGSNSSKRIPSRPQRELAEMMVGVEKGVPSKHQTRHGGRQPETLQQVNRSGSGGIEQGAVLFSRSTGLVEQGAVLFSRSTGGIEQGAVLFSRSTGLVQVG